MHIKVFVFDIWYLIFGINKFMSIKINKDLCIGCGTCEALCPDVFKVNAQGKSEVIKEEDLGCAKNAAESCPVQAIEVR